ncbi:MAG: SPFH domain-containing protein [Patescibacteria group bacterium]|nr:SPFH domain-containing protein [Patescibacteria group bacterium]
MELGLSLGSVIPILVVVALIFAVLNGITRRYRRVPPNKAMIVFGRGRQSRIITGGGSVIWPFIEDVKFLNLTLMTIDVKINDVNTKEGVRVSVDGVAQVKIAGDATLLNVAAEQLLDKSDAEIKDVALQTLEGHLRGILGRLTVEEVVRDQDAFSQNVQQTAATDMASMGIRIVSLTIKNISDDSGYLDALGKARTAAVKRDATVGEAEADREARQKVAEATRLAREAELAAEILVAEATKNKDVQVAEFRVQAETRKATADRAYDLQEADIKAQLATKNGAVAIETQRQAALAQEQSIEVAKKTKEAEVVVPARADQEAAIAKATGAAESRKLQAAADAEATKVTRAAEGEGLASVGLGEAEAIKAKLNAQAEGERQLADARSAQNEINLRQKALELIVEARVQIATATAQSLAGIGTQMRVVQFSGANGNGNGHTGNALLDSLMQLPELASIINAKSEALGGKDVMSLLREVGSLIGEKQAISQEGNRADPVVASQTPSTQKVEDAEDLVVGNLG